MRNVTNSVTLAQKAQSQAGLRLMGNVKTDRLCMQTTERTVFAAAATISGHR